MSEYQVLESSMSSYEATDQDTCFDDAATFYEESWKVEKVVAVIEKEEGRFYKVKWSRCIWQSEESLQPLQQLIQSYWQDHAANLSSTTNTNFVEHTVDCVNQNADSSIFNLNPQIEHLDDTSQNDEVLDEQSSDDGNPQSISLSVTEEHDSEHHITLTDTTNDTPLLPNSTTDSMGITFDQPFSMSCSGEKKFKCETCSKSFDRKTSLQRHCLIHSGEKPWHCEYCEKSFNQNSILQRHLLVHANHKTFHCDICARTFIEKGALKRHRATHTSEKAWDCSVCGKSFLLKEYLNKHMFLHTGTKPHQCKICERSFADSCSLRRHKSVHVCVKTHSCITCQKQFKSATSLKKHQQRCKALICLVCDARFDEENALSEHIQTHVCPFKCTQCRAEFETYSDLSAHIEIHTNQQLCCTLCPDEVFSSFKLLEKHMAKHHVSVVGDERFDMFETQVGVNETLKQYNDIEKKNEKIPKSFDELFKSALIP